MVTIAELRARNGKMSQEQLAKEIGVTRMTISNWEKNPMSLSSKGLIKLAKYFNVTTDELLGIKQK